MTKHRFLVKAFVACAVMTAALAAPAVAGVIDGTPGRDILVGTERGDRIHGLGGDDAITGLGGRDVVRGGDGDDLIFLGRGGISVRRSGTFSTPSCEFPPPNSERGQPITHRGVAARRHWREPENMPDQCGDFSVADHVSRAFLASCSKGISVVPAVVCNWVNRLSPSLISRSSNNRSFRSPASEPPRQFRRPFLISSVVGARFS